MMILYEKIKKTLRGGIFSSVYGIFLIAVISLPRLASVLTMLATTIIILYVIGPFILFCCLCHVYSVLHVLHKKLVIFISHIVFIFIFHVPDVQLSTG